jgi:DNA-binding MarR family transcriptional regulator
MATKSIPGTPSAVTASRLVDVMQALRAVDADMTVLSAAIFLDIAAVSLQGGQYPMTRIYERFDVATSTASRNIAYLSSHLVRRGREGRFGLGLIVKREDQNDLRAVNLELTAKGRSVAEQLHKAIT